MIFRAALLWILGLLTAVPYATWYLLFHADRSQYAALIVFILAWTFGYWGLVGPLIGALKARAVFKALERAQSSEDLERTLGSPEMREVVIDQLATENHIPRFVAAWVYRKLVRHLSGGAGGAALERLGRGKRPG